MLDLLKELCLANGISGNENQVRDLIISKIKGYCEYNIDNSGNLICFKKGQKKPQNKVMISAHMDEVGMIVTYINSDGTLKISTVGGIDPRVIFGRQVIVGDNNIVGVIGSKAVHNLSKEEKETAIRVENMYVDIGATSKEDALSVVSLGDSVYFKSDFVALGNDKVKCKAIDDRAGCAVLIELIRSELLYDTYFTFVTGEEIGLRGAKTAAYTVDPDIAIVLEATTAADIPGVNGEKRVCELSKGAVVSFMDRGTIYNKELYNLAFQTAKAENISVQTKTMIAGSNDSGAIHISKGGVKTLSVSVPCRYLHSPSCVIDKNDLKSVRNLVGSILDKVCNL